MPLSSSSITWYWSKVSDVLQLGRWTQAWWKVMAAYLPSDCHQFWDQLSVTGMGELSFTATTCWPVHCDFLLQYELRKLVALRTRGWNYDDSFDCVFWCYQCSFWFVIDTDVSPLEKVQEESQQTRRPACDHQPIWCELFLKPNSTQADIHILWPEQLHQWICEWRNLLIYKTLLWLRIKPSTLIYKT